MTHFFIFLMAFSIALSFSSIAEEESILSAKVEIDGPITFGLNSPQSEFAHKMLDDEKRTVAECLAELKNLKEIYITTVMSSPTHDDLIDVLSAEALANLNELIMNFDPSLIPKAGDVALGGMTPESAENSWKTSYENCYSQHKHEVDDFNLPFRRVLENAFSKNAEGIIVAKQPSTSPTLLNTGGHPYRTEELLKGSQIINNPAAESTPGAK